ncbi:hypothetical protein QWY85_18030 [Neolewinella lacunae]|uniref:Uncharacterized protein n=1 Tax=Neolewinella lacunae TaxID=1517758 RepID=A0A923PNM0_9BACT|nr:hypothetical protein [Neolewinella lacunae]MBC6995735.1 hypothetical protein [Neolewinella lacunae]MDN3636572.1 hypothetical protein [Neolewinella lacunae]
MQDAKVVQQIEAMDGRERERLRQFVRSPYFNRHEGTSRLLDFILKELAKPSPRLTEARAEDAVKGSGTEQGLADLQSSLMKLVNRFLAVEQLQQETFREEVLTLKRTRDLQRFELLENRGKRLDRMVDKHPYRDGDAHLAAYELKAIYTYHRDNANRSDTRNPQAMIDHLDRYYLVEKLRHACQLTANMMFRNTQYDLLFLDPMLAFLGSEKGLQLRREEGESSIDCYYHILLSLREPDEVVHYERMRYYLDEGLDRLPPLQRKDLFGFASNYCIQRIMSGHSDYRMELFSLYQRGITTGIMYNKEEISEWDYKNIVTLGSANGEVEWTEHFIEKNRERLPESKRENAYALNKAQFLYSLKRLDEAAKLLIRVTDSDVTYHLARVLLEVRIAYDQEDHDYALNLLETFRLYVRRNKSISVRDKRSYLNYTRYSKQLVNLKRQLGFVDRNTYHKKMTALHQSILETDPLVARQWLVQESSPAETSPA